MNSIRDEILALVQIMAVDKKTMDFAVRYFDGPGADASMKERTVRFIELLIQDGSAMGFDEGDDIGDIVWCMDDISERFHLMISDTWFEERDGLAGWLRTLGERWGRNGVELLCIEDPRGRMYPVYAAEASDVPGILQQAGRAGITIFPVRELGESAGESDMDVDFSELV